MIDRAGRWVVPVLLVLGLPVIVILLPVLPERDEVHGIDNDENGAVLTFCSPREPWVRAWPRFVDLR